MKLFSKKEKKAPAVKQATVEVDAEYYTHLLCKEYLIEAIAKVVADGDNEHGKVEKIAAILQIQLPPKNRPIGIAVPMSQKQRT